MKKSGNERFWLLPLYMACLIPLVMWGRIMPLNLSQYAWFPNREEGIDIFLASKQTAVMAVALVMLPAMVIYIGRKAGQGRLGLQIRSLRILSPFALYVALSVVSTLGSAYRVLGFGGCMDNYESIWVVMGYAVIVLYGTLVIKNARDSDRMREGILMMLAVSLGIVGLIGTMQTFGFDLLCTEAVSALVLHGELAGRAITSVTDKAYATLFNPNYLGVMGVMTVPLLLAEAVSAKALPRKGVYAASCILMFTAFWGSGSKSGRVMLAVCIGVLLFLGCRENIFRFAKCRYVFWTLLAVTVIVVPAAVLIFMTGSGTERGGRDTVIQSLRTNDTGVMLQCHDRSIIMTLDIYGSSMPEIVSVCDPDGIPYEMACDSEDVLYFAGEMFPELSITAVQYEDYISIDLRELTGEDTIRHWYFTNQTEDGTYRYVTVFGKTDVVDSAEIPVYAPLQGYEDIVSGRGYIWSRALPLLARHLLLGSGQDSFTAVFPNGDYLGKTACGYENVLISRPHSLYLQIGIQSGGIALAAYLGFFVLLMLRLISRRDSPTVSGLIASLLGYLLMGITNDSSVTTSPVFYLIVSLALSFA